MWRWYWRWQGVVGVEETMAAVAAMKNCIVAPAVACSLRCTWPCGCFDFHWFVELHCFLERTSGRLIEHYCCQLSGKHPDKAQQTAPLQRKGLVSSNKSLSVGNYRTDACRHGSELMGLLSLQPTAAQAGPAGRLQCTHQPCWAVEATCSMQHERALPTRCLG